MQRHPSGRAAVRERSVSQPAELVAEIRSAGAGAALSRGAAQLTAQTSGTLSGTLSGTSSALTSILYFKLGCKEVEKLNMSIKT